MPSDIQHSWSNNGRDIQKLLHDLAMDDFPLLRRHGYKRSLDEIFDDYWFRQQNDRRLYQLIDRDILLKAIDESYNISFKSLRRIAHSLGVSICSLLSGDGLAAHMPLITGKEQEPEQLFLPLAEKQHHDHELILERIMEALESTSKPVSLKALARNLDVSVGYIEYRFPLLVRKIVQRNTAYIARQKEKRRLDARRCVLEFFESEKYGHYRKSRKQAYKVIRQETGLPKHLLKDEIQQVYQMRQARA